MSIDDPTKVDFLVLERGGGCVLIITDHLEWEQPLEHLYALQEKFNTYAAFVETGQVWDEASAQAGRAIAPGSVPIGVNVVLQHAPPSVFFEFLEHARAVFAPLKVSVAYEVRAA